MKRRILWPAGCSIALLACGGGGGGDGGGMPPPVPTCTADGVSAPRAFPGLSFASPVAMLQAPNDGSRWFVVEQGGRIRTFENNAAATTAADFADLRARVHMDGEAGLLGMAFHPDFAANGRVYLNFSELVGGQIRSVTAEFTSMDGGQTLNPASERDLLTVAKPAANHNGGNLAFGPDGFLYLGLGDGGGAGDPNGNGQNPRALLGKMLRIDVDSRPGGAPYGIPGGANGNPFSANPLCNVDGTGIQNCPEIYALGFRNPWRWSFDSQSGDLWVGDVGQDRFEEIDLVERSRNYGWNAREGAHCFSPSSGCATAGLTDPVAEYGHSVGFSIIGGYVYRGAQTTQIAGRYVFGDLGGMIAALAPNGTGGFNVEELVEQGCTPAEAQGALQISAFAEDLDGELFVIDYGRGQIRELEFTD
jgi:glucose/arabinose dehydrogenase